MRGAAKPISLARRFIIDFMHASVPHVAIKRTMNLERLVKARRERWLRTFYIAWPWPHFYEVPKSVAMIAIVRDDFERDATFILRIGAADEYSLTDLEAIIQRGSNLPLEDQPSMKRLLRLTRLPLPLRRLIWTVGLNIGRQRANYFGTFGVTSLVALGSETVAARTPGPAFITYGFVRSDYTMELLLHWDHRIYDGVLAARALRDLEDVLNTVIAEELLAGASPNSQ